MDVDAVGREIEGLHSEIASLRAAIADATIAHQRRVQHFVGRIRYNEQRIRDLTARAGGDCGVAAEKE